MEPERRRGLTITDLMILIAVVALGISWSETIWAEAGPFRHASPVEDWAGLLVNESTWFLLRYTTAPAVLAMPALLFLTLRPPRPRFDALIREPGFVSTLASTAVLAYSTGTLLTRSLVFFGLELPADMSLDESARDLVISANFLFQDVAARISLFTILAWLGMWVGGAWKPAGEPIERLRRALGAYWIAMIVPLGLHVHRF